MTDKQIIIDGVDVSGCPYYIDSEGDCSSHDCECIKCIHNVCFYKDYKAKEQECEELKKQLKQAEQKLAEKDKEIERLKQGIKHYQRGMFSIINTATECRNNKKWNYK